jgi:hypothetical protein
MDAAIFRSRFERKVTRLKLAGQRYLDSHTARIAITLSAAKTAAKIF